FHLARPSVPVHAGGPCSGLLSLERPQVVGFRHAVAIPIARPLDGIVECLDVLEALGVEPARLGILPLLAWQGQFRLQSLLDFAKRRLCMHVPRERRLMQAIKITKIRTQLVEAVAYPLLLLGRKGVELGIVANFLETVRAVAQLLFSVRSTQ